MGYILIKPVAEHDEYVYWSTITGTPIACGDREEMLAELTAEWHRDHGADVPPAGLSAPLGRIARADRWGSSALNGWYRWDDQELIYEQRGLLARKDLYRAALLLCDDRESEVWDLLTPLDEHAAVRRD